LEKLGWGATATVFRCSRNDNAGCSYALKMVSLGRLKLQPNYTELVETLHQEIAILLSLQHPRVVSLVDVVERTDSLGIIMELVQGGSLENYIAGHGVLPEAEASHIFVQLADGLTYIHGRGVIHQDLKPDNILIDEHASKPERAEVKLADFGQARVLGDLHGASPANAGTPLYRAPEATDPVRKKGAPDFSADLWSLGVVLFVMLVGSCPFSGSGTELQRAIRSGNFSFYSDDGNSLPSKEAQSLVNGLLKVDPKKRLSLDWCLVHPFVAPTEALAKRLLHLIFAHGPNPLQERYWLPGVLCDRAAYALRQTGTQQSRSH
jgi:serine/threonine-protein kinase Chk2